MLKRAIETGDVIQIGDDITIVVEHRVGGASRHRGGVRLGFNTDLPVTITPAYKAKDLAARPRREPPCGLSVPAKVTGIAPFVPKRRIAKGQDSR